MDCATFKELAALFALGALEPAERAACEAHLAAPEHDGCLEVLTKAMASVSSLDDHGATPPPAPRVWSAIAERITPSARRLRAARRRSLVTTALAVACAAALVLVVLNRRHVAGELEATRTQLATRDQTVASAVQRLDACTARVETIEAAERLRNEAVGLLELPGTQLFPLAPEKGHKAAAANAIMHTGLKRAYVVAEGLTTVPDRDYELWVAKGKKVVPAGLVTVDPRGRALVRIDYATLLGDVGAPDAMMITLEPRGGSLGAPGPTVLFGTPRT